MELKSIREIEALSVEEKIRYFSTLREQCVGLSKKDSKKKNLKREILMNLYQSIVPGYDYVLEGEENIPEDGRVLFACNHSNSHDFFAAQEVMRRLGTRVSILSGEDCLNSTNQSIFKACDAVMIDRRDEVSTHNGIIEFSSDIIDGMPGWMFPESTWNMHPIKPMQDIKIGVTLIAAITDVPIVPVTFEYVEVPYVCENEKELYRVCKVRFGKPINILRSYSLKTQSGVVLDALKQNRLGVWEDVGIRRNSIKDIDPKIYLNHASVKKFLAFGFKYDTKYEEQFLYKPKGVPFENEYHMNENGVFEPGIISFEEAKRYVKKL